jgi:cholesterol transport system auxiliary component
VNLNHILITVSIALSSLLAGCASTDPVSATYDFGPMPALAASGPAAPEPPDAPQAPSMTLAVADASGPSWLDSRTMYYRLLYAKAQQSHPYSYHRWSAPPLQLLSARLKSRIAQSGIDVLSVTDASTDTLLLRIAVEDFSQYFDSQQTGSGNITLRASLFRARHLVRQKTFTRATRITSADAIGGARALAASSDALAFDIIAWLAALPLPRE